MNSDPNVQYDMNAMQYEMTMSHSPSATQCAATVARNCETPLIHHVGAAATVTDYCDILTLQHYVTHTTTRPPTRSSHK